MKTDGFYRQTVGEKETKFSILSKIEAIDEAVQKATAFASNAGFGDDALFGIDMAVREALANAVKHGNQLDETKQVEVTLINLESGMEIMIRDFGKGFDVTEVPDPTNPENLLKASGRGILFMHNFVDKVEWQRHAEGGMIVKMIKNC
ncbi:MAG: ATP-binding protein [Actinomycetota bacterium]